MASEKQLQVQLIRFFFPTFLLLLGIFFTIYGLMNNQTSDFMIGGYSMIAGGLISFLFIFLDIPKMAEYILLLVMLALSAFLIFRSYMSVKEHIRKQESYEQYVKQIKQAYADIGLLQAEYKKHNGRYAADFNELKSFAVVDTFETVIPRPVGDVPPRVMNQEERDKMGYVAGQDDEKISNISEEDAITLGLIERKKYPISAVENLFNGRTYKFTSELDPTLNGDVYFPPKFKAKDRVYKFDLDKIEKKHWLDSTLVDEFGFKLEMKTGIIAADSSSYIYIKDPKPYNPFNKLDVFEWGSEEKDDNKGSWEE